MKTTDEVTSWRGRMLARLTASDKRAAERYRKHLATTEILREMVELNSRGQLTNDKWIEFRDRAVSSEAEVLQ